MEMKDASTASSSLARAFDVLDLFSLEQPTISIEDIMNRLAYTRSMSYRYLKELCDGGFLAPSVGASYRLGPRIIELERLSALTDPLYRAGKIVLGEIPVTNSAYLLQSLYGDKVLCLLKHGPDVLDHDGEQVIIRRGRGLPFPLFQGSGSLALLAHLPTPRIQQTYLRYAQQIAAADLGDDWEQFRTTLRNIRKRGYATSHQKITPLLGGVAVPIIIATEKRMVGSLAHTFLSDDMNPEMEARTAAELQKISARIAEVMISLQQSSNAHIDIYPSIPSFDI